MVYKPILGDFRLHWYLNFVKLVSASLAEVTLVDHPVPHSVWNRTVGNITATLGCTPETEAAKLLRSLVAGLVDDALEDGFLDNVTAENLPKAAANAALVAIEGWCHGLKCDVNNVAQVVWEALIRDLETIAWAELRQREDNETELRDELAEAFAHGDIDADGNWLPYQKSYWGPVA